MENCRTEYEEKLRKELYRMNMELPYWEARGDTAMVEQIRAFIAETKWVLDNKGRLTH